MLVVSKLYNFGYNFFECMADGRKKREDLASYSCASIEHHLELHEHNAYESFGRRKFTIFRYNVLRGCASWTYRALVISFCILMVKTISMSDSIDHVFVHSTICQFQAATPLNIFYFFPFANVYGNFCPFNGKPNHNEMSCSPKVFFVPISYNFSWFLFFFSLQKKQENFPNAKYGENWLEMSATNVTKCYAVSLKVCEGI